MNEKRVANAKRFAEVYLEKLREAVTKSPQEYCYSVEQVPTVVGRMEAAFVAGTYNHDSKAIRATCKHFGFKHTRTAMEAFFNS